jgi:hypothetical protein
MTTNKRRLKKLESAMPKGARRIGICYEHEDTVRVDGVEMSRAEWDKTAKDNDVLLVVISADEAIKDGDE